MMRKIKSVFNKLLLIIDDDIGFFAASLSFYSVLSIIPMLWVLFFILDQLGAFADYYELVKIFLADSLIPVHAEMITGYLQDFMKNANRTGSVGLIYILITSVMFYRNYQYVVNKIFLVPNHSLLHSIATYLILGFLMPATLGVSFYLSDYLQRIVGETNFGFGGFAFLSFMMIWALFFVLYKVSPNMRISIRIALKVSFVAALVWHVVKWLFVQYMLVNQTYSSLYGSFSALLFLLIWIYLSWLLLLHGLKACYLMHCRYGRYG
jgi:membrane protein